MQVVLPRVPDAAVDLDALLRGTGRRRAGGRLRDVNCAMTVGIGGVDAHRRVVHRGSRALEVERDVGELVLDRLERSDRYVELHALLGVRDRAVEQ